MCRQITWRVVVAGLVVLSAVFSYRLVVGAAFGQGVAEKGVAAPEFTHSLDSEWINSGPLTLADLRGKVVLLDFWTFDCWNCYRSFPWLKALEARLSDRDFTVIGVHTPEFDHERIRANIEKKVEEFGLRHPVMIDNDFSYWRSMGNRYWPAFYLIDKRGAVRAVFVGETHEGDRQALKIENAILELLDESV